MVEFSYARDDKYNLAYIGATVLNYVLTCLADVCATKKKFKNMATLYVYLSPDPFHKQILP